MQITRDNWIVLGILLVVVAVFVTLVYVPQIDRISTCNGETAKVAALVNDESARAACVPDMIRQVEQTKRQFKNFDRRLPKQKELAEFLKDISTAIMDERLENQVIEPGNPTRGELYNRLPIIMKFNGTFTGVASFLRRLDQMERLTRIERISIKQVKEEGQAMQVEMQMNIYFTES